MKSEVATLPLALLVGVWRNTSTMTIQKALRSALHDVCVKYIKRWFNVDNG
jgi:hypothetical protein